MKPNPAHLEKLRARGKQAFEWWIQGLHPEVLPEFPAQRLIRVIDEPPSREWPQVWVAAGGRLVYGMMVALKLDPVWTKISLFGLPYPPFDYFDNMDIEDVDRAEAEALGLLNPGSTIVFQQRTWSEDVLRIG